MKTILRNILAAFVPRLLRRPVVPGHPSPDVRPPWPAGVHGFVLLSIGLLIQLAALAASPVITSQPQSQTVSEAQNVKFQVGAASSEAIAYQWRQGASDLTGQTNSSLLLIGVTSDQNGLYSVAVGNSSGSVTSNPANLTVNAPNLGPQPIAVDNMTEFRGQNNRVILVRVLGTASSGSIWGTDVYTDDSHLGLAAVHAGLLNPGEAGIIAVEVLPGQESYTGSTRNGVTSSDYGNWAGSYALRYRSPVITEQPISQAVLAGNDVLFEVSASSGGAPLHFQWMFNGGLMPSETNSYLLLEKAAHAQAGLYTVAVGNPQGAVASEAATLIVVDRNAGSPALSDPGAAQGLSVPWRVYWITMTGDTNGGAIWGDGFYTSDSPLKSAAVHAGMLPHGETGTVGVLRLPGRASYRSASRNDIQSLAYPQYRDSYILLYPLPTFTENPMAQAAWAGSQVVFHSEAVDPAGASYQWFFNGNPLPGETGPTLTLDSLRLDQSGVYVLVASNADGPIGSLPAKLAVVDRSTPVISVSSASDIGSYANSNGAVLQFPLSAQAASGTIYGDGYYTTDSTSSGAAVHAGILADGQTAVVNVVIVGVQPEFYAATRHGVSTYAFGRPYPAFAFISDLPSFAARITLKMKSRGQLEIQGPSGWNGQVLATDKLGVNPWTLVHSLQLTQPVQTWTDPSAISQPQRLYQVRATP